MTVLKTQEPPPAEGFRKYLPNVSWMLLERIFSMGLAFVVSIYTANYLAAEGFGKFNFARSFAGLVTVAAPLGIGAVMVRNLINRPEERTLTFGSVFAVRIIASTVCVLLAALLSFVFNFWWKDDLKMWMVILAALPVLFETFNMLGSFYNTQAQARFHVLGELSKSVVAAVVKLLLIFVFKASPIWFAVTLIVDPLVYAAVVLSVYKIRYDETPLNWRVNRTYALEMVRQSLPLVLAEFVIILYMRLDQIMIGFTLNDIEVGKFAAALRFSEATFFIPVILSNALLPAIIAARKVSENRFSEQTQKLSDLLVLSGLVIAAGVSVCSPWIFKYLYEPEYADAQTVLVIHVWSGIMVGLGMVANSWLVAANLQKYSLNRTLWGVAVNVVLNLLFIPWLGINGAAIATLFSQSVASYLSNYIALETRPLFWIQTRSLFGLGFLSPLRDILSGRLPIK
ncbi:MAG: flippase [Cytophagales bacterium]|nr:flippase [Cytophagales bacterium]